MAQREVPIDHLARFLPPGTSRAVTSLLNHYKVHLTISRQRKTILGDYRHATLFKAHRISVNGNMNAYAFLITLIHELAHLVTFMEHGNRAAAHGREWKQIYALLLNQFLQQRIFPDDIEKSLQRNMHDLPASSCADEDLVRILRRYDRIPNGLVLVEQVGEGQLFEISKGRLFKRGRKLRKRYECIEMDTGKVYLFSPVFEVRAV